MPGPISKSALRETMRRNREVNPYGGDPALDPPGPGTIEIHWLQITSTTKTGDFYYAERYDAAATADGFDGPQEACLLFPPNGEALFENVYYPTKLFGTSDGVTVYALLDAIQVSEKRCQVYICAEDTIPTTSFAGGSKITGQPIRFGAAQWDLGGLFQQDADPWAYSPIVIPVTGTYRIGLQVVASTDSLVVAGEILTAWITEISSSGSFGGKLVGGTIPLRPSATLVLSTGQQEVLLGAGTQLFAMTNAHSASGALTLTGIGPYTTFDFYGITYMTVELVSRDYSGGAGCLPIEGTGDGCVHTCACVALTFAVGLASPVADLDGQMAYLTFNAALCSFSGSVTVGDNTYALTADDNVLTITGGDLLSPVVIPIDGAPADCANEYDSPFATAVMSSTDAANCDGGGGGEGHADFELAGLTNGTCSDCASLNAAFSLPQLPSIQTQFFGDNLASICGGTLNAYLLRSGTPASWRLYLTVTIGASTHGIAEYANTSVGADWDGSTMTMDLVSNSIDCDDWPATLDVTATIV